MTEQNAESNSTKHDKKSLPEKIPAWLLPILGAAIYAAGYLVVVTFLESFGLKEVYLDFWKGRYIHIGALALALPTFVCVICYFVTRGVTSEEKEGSESAWNCKFIFAGIFTGILVLTQFIMIAFMRRHSSVDHESTFDSLKYGVGVTLTFAIGLAYVGKFLREYRSIFHYAKDKSFWPKMRKCIHIIAWILLSVTSVWFLYRFIYCYSDFFRHFWQLKRETILAFLIYLFVLGLISVRVVRRGPKWGKDTKVNALMIVAAIGIPLYLLSLLSFAFSVFPFIPATKGGGDYTVVPQVKIYLKNKDIDTNAPFLSDYFDSANRRVIDQNALLIEETSSLVYVAKFKNANEPNLWRKGEIKPEILAINRADIANILYEPEKKCVANNAIHYPKFEFYSIRATVIWMVFLALIEIRQSYYIPAVKKNGYWFRVRKKIRGLWKTVSHDD